MKTIAIIATALAALLLPAAAQAHATLDRAVPAVGSTVSAAPKEVVLNFTSKLEAAFSTIEVRNAQGTAMQSGKTIVKGAQMRVPVKALPPGAYKVIWKVLSVDTHRTQGDFTFTVGP